MGTEFIHIMLIYPNPRGYKRSSFQAGFLASGSAYLSPLPVEKNFSAVVVVIFIPGHSGGSVPEFHRIPF